MAEQRFTPLSGIKPVVVIAEGEGGGYLGANWSKQNLTYNDFEDYLIDVTDNYVKDHPQGILTPSDSSDRESLLDASDVEKASVKYLTELLNKKSESEDRIAYYNALNDATHTLTINWENLIDSKGGIISDVGTFFEDKIFGLREETGLGKSDPRPDILKILADIKTYAGLSETNFKISIASITTEGVYVNQADIYTPLSKDDENALKAKLSNDDVLLEIALYKLLFKMSSFLYIRLDNARRGKETQTVTHILAFIYFYRLIIKKLEEHFLRTEYLSQGRIAANTSSSNFARKSPRGWEYIRNIEVSLEKSFSNVQGPVNKMIEELKFLREIYAKEYTLINEIKRLKGQEAKTFYATINKEESMHEEFSPVTP